MSFDVEGAKKAGYSESEIAAYLAQQRQFDLDGAKKAGYSDADILSHLTANEPKQEKPQERSFLDSVGRQLGLTARSAIGGVGGLANMVADPVVGLANRMGAGLPIPSQALERTMTRAGLPEPASGTERFAQSVNRGMVAPVAIGAAVPRLATGIGTQVLSSGMGAGSTELAKEAGVGPTGQFVAGLAGGMVAPAAVVATDELSKAGVRAAGALFEPMTETGREKIVARTLQGSARDKRLAADAARSYQTFVPGSEPTLAQATADEGLSALEKALRTRNPAAFAERAAAQDAARQAGLERSFGTATDLAMAEAERDAVTKPLREAAFQNARKVNTKPILNSADTILKSGAGARQEVERAMAWVKSRLEGETDPERIYAIRQDINDIIAGKMRDPEKASYQLAAGQLKAIKAVLDQQLERSAPGFKNYLSQYADRSRAIGAMETGQEIASKSLNPMTEKLSAAQFARQMQNRSEDVANMGSIGSDALARVNQDLKRAVAPEAMMRAPGSDTSQNIIAQSILSQSLGPNQARALPRIGGKVAGLLYSPFEQRAQEQLLEAMMDPKKASGLLSMQLSQDPRLADELLRRLVGVPYGGLLGVGAGNPNLGY